MTRLDIHITLIHDAYPKTCSYISFTILSFYRYDLRSLHARSDFLVVRKSAILKYKILLGKHLVVLTGN
jgi:hypothetical protein